MTGRLQGTSFVLVDVFADAPLTGNPLALVPDADHLAETTMRAIAREFNQSETTFLLTPTRPEATWRLRSFTPDGSEVVGAGHNAMGAWLWLAMAGRLPSSTSTFRQQLGTEVLDVGIAQNTDGRTVVSMSQLPARLGRTTSDRHGLADALGLGPDDLDADVAAQVVSTGSAHLLVPMTDRDAVDRSVPDARLLLPVLQDVQAQGCYLYSLDPLDPDGGSVAYTRFFNPTVGIAEDPATGTAAGPLVAALVACGRLPDGTDAVVEQGHRLGRPSRLRVSTDRGRVQLHGVGVLAAEGTLHLT